MVERASSKSFFVLLDDNEFRAKFDFSVLLVRAFLLFVAKISFSLSR